MYIYIYIIDVLYVYIYIYIYIYMYIYTHTHTNTYTYANTGREIYFFGIIDFLQEYNMRKRSETIFRRIFHKKKDISCVSYVCAYIYIYIYMYMYMYLHWGEGLTTYSIYACVHVYTGIHTYSDAFAALGQIHLRESES